MKSNKILHFFTFGDIAYDQRMQRIWHSLHTEGFAIEIFARALYDVHPETPYSITRYKPLFRKGFLAYAEFNIRAFFRYIFRPVSHLTCVDLDTLLAGTMVKFFKRCKLTYDAHELYTELPELIASPTVRAIWRGIARLCIPRCNTIYTVSHSISKYFFKHYHKAAGVVRNMPKYTFTGIKKMIHVSDETRVLVYQGAVNEGRGLESLVSAMPMLPNFHLYIAGIGDKLELVQSLVNQKKLENQVFLLGNLLPEDLKSLTLKADLGINLLENKGLSYYYSLANKFFDYVQAGVPQLCIDFPEYKKLNSQYKVAYLIKDINPMTIVKAIKDIFSQPELYNHMSGQTAQASKNWSWEIEEKELLKIYSENNML